MRTPYGLDISESCQSCKLSADGFFCKLASAALRDFDAVQSTSVYPRGSILFVEKQDARGIFVLCEGQVKLSINSREGRTLILTIAEAGEVLGLSAVLQGRGYEVTAETCRPSQVAFVRSDDFLQFVAHHPETYPSIVMQLIRSYDRAREQLRSVGLSEAVPKRLCRLLLDWPAGSKGTMLRDQIKVNLTHEEIGELIGSSRETVTRALSNLRDRGLVAMEGSSLTISNRAALLDIVGE
jgi:CRP/FNR family transcriptional regulator, cyclic AMP receptor protein